MLVLVTNDDGIHSPALLALVQGLRGIAQIVVSAPAQEQSGVGHAFTFYKPLRYNSEHHLSTEAYAVSGTPADCVKLAICEILQERRPDLVISGINNGENAGVAVPYSGTVAGAREGALWGIPSIALSVTKADSTSLKHAVAWICMAVQAGHWKQMGQGTFWNVNFPPGNPKGMHCVAMGTSMFVDEYLRSEKNGVVEYQLTGYKERHDLPQESDDWWIQQGYATLTPLQIDQTSHAEIARISEWANACVSFSEK